MKGQVRYDVRVYVVPSFIPSTICLEKPHQYRNIGTSRYHKQ